MSFLCVITVMSFTEAEDREPRRVFNDDAQMLMEAPLQGTSDHVRAWLDRRDPGGEILDIRVPGGNAGSLHV